MTPHVALVIDDNDAHRAAETDACTSLGYEVREASSLNEALEILSKTTVCVVLLDLEIPVRKGGGPSKDTGRAALERIVAAHPTLPVIVVTAFGQTKYAVDCLKLGAADFAVKPLDDNDEPLPRKIQEALAKACARGGGCTNLERSRGTKVKTRTYSAPDLDLQFHGEARGRRHRVDVNRRPVDVTKQGMEILLKLVLTDLARDDGYLDGEDLVGPGHKTAVARLEKHLAAQGVTGLIEKSGGRYRVTCRTDRIDMPDETMKDFKELLLWSPPREGQGPVRHKRSTHP